MTVSSDHDAETRASPPLFRHSDVTSHLIIEQITVKSCHLTFNPMIATGRSNRLLNDVAKLPRADYNGSKRAVKTELILDRYFPLKCDV